jgi:hypothetical protein
MVEIFLPDELLNTWVAGTNAYAESLLAPEHRQKEITMPDILRFLETIQQLGVVKLPAKHDYFPGNSSDYYPITQWLSWIRRGWNLEYLWRYFHTSYKSGEPDETLDHGSVDDDDTASEEDGEEVDDEDDTPKVENSEEAQSIAACQHDESKAIQTFRLEDFHWWDVGKVQE